MGYLWPVACLRTLRELPFIFLKNLTTKDALEHAFNVTWTTNVFIIASNEQVFVCGSSKVNRYILIIYIQLVKLYIHEGV